MSVSLDRDGVVVSMGGSIKVTRKVGDSFVSVEVSRNLSVPAKKGELLEVEAATRFRVQKGILSDLQKQIERVEREVSISLE